MLALVLQKLTFKKEGGKVSVRELSAVNAITDFLRIQSQPLAATNILFGINTFFKLSSFNSLKAVYILALVLQRTLGLITVSFQVVIHLHLMFKDER